MTDLSTSIAKKQVEQWRTIPGWAGLYEVSDLGRVRSLKHYTHGGGGSFALRGGRILKPALSYAYEVVTLSNRTLRCTKRVHVMVLEAFVGSRPDGMQACHWDGNARNNSAANLYWGTPKENAQDKVRHGTSRYALKRGHCKQGHPFDEENTYVSASGTPICRRCRREGMRRKGRVS